MTAYERAVVRKGIVCGEACSKRSDPGFQEKRKVWDSRDEKIDIHSDSRLSAQ